MQEALYHCEKCGKLVFEKFASGRFCSRECANSHIQTPEQNERRSEKLAKFVKIKCMACGKEYLGRKWTHRKTCSDECLKAIRAEQSKDNLSGGERINSGRSKCGFYKGIYCGSTYELAFLVYCLDNNIEIKRNTDYFTYVYDGLEHKYYPDFKVNNRTYVEIKGIHTDIVDVKLASVTKPKLILFKDKLKACFDHLVNKYGLNYNKGNNNFYLLYDK